MDSTLYTGQGVVQTVVNAGQFKPDFVWQKARAEVANHRLVDSVRGVDKVLYSSSTAAEATTDGVVDSFNSNGFTGGGSDVVTSGQTAVAWQWQAGQGSTSSNTSGTITSTVSVNTTAGFSIVTFTSNNTGGATVGHGLGVKPSMIILKRRPSTSDWDSYHTSLGATKGISLNTTGTATTSVNYWNNTEPTSSLFTLGAGVNPASTTMLAYCFAEIAGYSKFGSYTGNGSADGSFIFTGFQPKFVLIKRTDSGNNWFILDTARDTFNLANDQLLPNSSAAESTGTDCNIDILSNGFKLRTALDASNGSGGTYIYACFASNPFKNSNAR
jgi:hypothetical protein